MINLEQLSDTDPATDKQWKLLRRLMDERGVTVHLSEDLSERGASEAISQLMALPRSRRSVAEPGWYLCHDALYRVRSSDKGRTYAEHWSRSQSSGRWRWKLVPGKASELGEAVAITEEEGRAWMRAVSASAPLAVSS